MDITLNAPALLFPTISLLMLAYTNRFLALATLIRNLHAKYQEDHSPIILAQLKSLRLRLRLIRDMQLLGVVALLLCVICIYVVFENNQVVAKNLFMSSLILLITSLCLSIVEIFTSMQALYIQISDIENTSLLAKIKHKVVEVAQSSTHNHSDNTPS